MQYKENVLKRVRMLEEKKGIRYAKTNGRLYTCLKVLYIIAYAAVMAMNLMYLAGMMLVNYGTDRFAGVADSVITVAICTALLTAGFVLSFFRFKITAGIMNVVPALILIPVFALLLEDSLGFFGRKAAFYIRHFIPLVLLVIFIAWMVIIAVRERVKTRRQYTAVMENLYRIYNENSDDDVIDDEEWDKFVDSYDPTNYKALFKENA